MITFERLKRSASARFCVILGWLLTPIIIILATNPLWKARKALTNADVVAIYESGGFGHHIITPDILRRLFPSERIVLLLAALPVGHNWSLPTLWPSPEIFMLRFAFTFSCGNKRETIRMPYPIQVRFCRYIANALRLCYPQKQHIIGYRELQSKLWRQIRATDQTGTSDGRNLTNQDWPIAYFHLMRRCPAPPVYLPRADATLIGDCLVSALGTAASDRRGLCCLYLRSKGANSNEEIESSSRSGSPIDTYLQAVEYINSKGYQCLITGDRQLTTEIAIKFGGWLVDAASLGIDAEKFSLFALTEADIFIGEAGGASFLPGINEIPTLIVNNLPAYQTRVGATTFFKIYRDELGVAISPQRVLTEFAHAYQIPGGSVSPNTATEILNAVTDFIENRRDGEPYGIKIDDIVEGVHDTWYHDAQSRISPAWLTAIGHNPPPASVTDDNADQRSAAFP
jgi:putative glycosyltransferase (TIGR04372 family)